ncbi:SDR family oxidoreductase [Pedobacter sp. L105]|uniref:SDR family oxidoreductase n=1 Tax=Pedobacter sp. L105 TaxID=1641871 RepID=UPI00131EAA9A|nr:SDR family oxidoreductase [Pedobacter sp. L105]
MDTQKVWYVTGASKGLGLALVKKLLEDGYRVAATSRNLKQLIEAVDVESSDFLPLEVDLTSDESVKESLEKTWQIFKSVDVVVNNAGYGIGGTIEELTDSETRSNFDVNVFGTLNVIRQVMPYLRGQKSGHIINISSIGGFAGATGWSVYAASKFAIVGLSEVLAEDVKEFGIKVTVVMPGGFRTNFLSADSIAYAAERIEGYTSVAASHAKYRDMDGAQIGDPDKAADVFIELVTMKNPPVRLFIGSDAQNRALKKVETLADELKEFATLTVSTDY